MNDAIKGMTTAEARALVNVCRNQMYQDCNEPMCGAPTVGRMDQLLALAALGAEVVGAKEGWMRSTDDVLSAGGSVALSWKPLTTMNSVVVVRRVLVLESE